ncbi:pyridoxal phosphate-dependent aminotransferase [Dactylosporangium sp. NPDC000521]|uniref:pyridoxal phosphate-dependent aminotransferase n=1 Tax=Dactylosporangium sp. NPDC000521 TaxID=3363975 RepID=UPI0036B35136
MYVSLARRHNQMRRQIERSTRHQQRTLSARGHGSNWARSSTQSCRPRNIRERAIEIESSHSYGETVKPESAGFSPLALRTPRSGIREVLEVALTLPDVSHLEIGEPAFATPQHVVDAACQALRDGWTKYTSNEGVPALREALAAKVTRVNGIPAEASQMIVTTGAVEGLYASLFALCDEGDEILLPDPGWSNYLSMAHLIRARAVGYSLVEANGYLPDPDEIESLITPRTKVLLLNSPSNPVGTIIDRTLMQRLLEVADRHGLWVISDECYDQLSFTDGFVSAAAVADNGRIITAHSFSKTYAMTGWRIGYLTLPPGVAGLVAKIHEPIVSCVSSVGQAAALAALTGPQDFIAESVGAYLRNRDLVIADLRGFGLEPAVVPSGAFYVWLKVPGVEGGSKRLALDLLREARVATAPGTAFGVNGDDYLRISFGGTRDDVRTGVARLGEYLSSVQASRRHGPVGVGPARESA